MHVRKYSVELEGILVFCKSVQPCKFLWELFVQCVHLVNFNVDTYTYIQWPRRAAFFQSCILQTCIFANIYFVNIVLLQTYIFVNVVFLQSNGVLRATVAFYRVT